MDGKLLEILVCPLCKAPLIYQQGKSELVCKADRLAYPVKDDIPVLVEAEARSVDSEELDSLS